MTSPFDIFRRERDGSVLWLGTTTTLEAAKTRVQELTLHAPAEFVLLNQNTGDKLVIGLRKANGAAGSSVATARNEALNER